MNLAAFTKLQKILDQNLIDIGQSKRDGRKVIGFYCLYSPIEIAVAVGGIPVSLSGTRNDPIEAAEKVLPRNLCPLIKSSYGNAATDTCPYFRFSDLVVGETTCDGKKKMFELLAEFRPIHILQLSQTQGSDGAMSFWYNEIVKFKKRVEKETGVEITYKKLSEAIQLTNQERKAKRALMDLQR